MPTLNIKNPRVYELARELSEVTGKSMTSVIELALEKQLAEFAQRRAGVADQLLALGKSASPQLQHLSDDPSADLYDQDTGLPR